MGKCGNWAGPTMASFTADETPYDTQSLYSDSARIIRPTWCDKATVRDSQYLRMREASAVAAAPIS